MASRETPKRVPKQSIVRPAPVILPKGHPDLAFLGDALESDASRFASTRYFGGAFVGSGSGGSDGGSSGPSVSGPSGITAPIFVIPDVPSPSDIESITYEEYPDSTGVMKYRAVLKIRNSSVNKENVAGVDARIYNPNAARTYAFGSGTASTTTTGPSGPTGPAAPSPFASNVTWYNAKSVCDPVNGVYGSFPYLAGTAQYREDGVGVPSDSISGPNRARIKSVWRKTEAEAFEAALNAACGIV
jgi:hypothetical protein